MKRRIDENQGLAIITTMLVLTLLLGLIAAFLVVNRAGNRFTVSSVERRTAQDMCMTAFTYAWFSLEKDRAWGNGDAPINVTEQYPLTSPQVRMVHSQDQDVPVITVEGVYSQNGNFDEPQGTFTMIIENNLSGRAPSETGSSAVDVPARAVRVEVEARVGGVTKKLTTLLRPKPISHDGLAAGNNVNLDDTTGQIRIESRDPYVNRIRAGNNLNLPYENDVRFLKHGIGASVNELNLGGTNLATASDDAVRSAGETSGGIYKPKAHPLIVEQFDPNEITLPNNSTNIPAGTWTFGEVTAIEYIEHTLTFDTPPPPGSEPGTPGGSGTTNRYQRKTSLYNQLTSPDGEVYTAEQAIEGSEELDPPYDPEPNYNSEGAAMGYGYGDNSDATSFTGNDVHELATGFWANVTTAQMVVHPEIALRVPGDFIVEATGDRLPELYFGYKLTGGGVATQLSLIDGLEEAQDNPGKYMAGIVADGDVNVTGGVLGYGSMLAGGDLTIKASSGLRVAPELGVVVKGNRVIINPASEPEPGSPGQPVPFDYDIYRGAIQAESGGDWTLYNGWLDHDQPTRDGVIASLGQTSTGDEPVFLWNQLCEEIADVPYPSPPNFSAHGWPVGPATVDQYMRLKEFLQTQLSGYNGGDGDPSWLNLGLRQEDSAGRVAGVLNGIAQWSKSFKQTFQAYLENPDQAPPDMFLEGLVYAEEDIIIDATGKSIRLEGAVVAKNDVNITSPSAVDIVYNRSLLDDLTAAGGFGPVRLEKVFFTLE